MEKSQSNTLSHGIRPNSVGTINGCEEITVCVCTYKRPKLLERLGPTPFDVVLSDMSPSISGAYSTDHARSVDLVRSAWGVAARVLAPGGAFVAKVFDGELVARLETELASAFASVRRTKPPASREASSELYLVARGFEAPSAVKDPSPRGGRGSAI